MKASLDTPSGPEIASAFTSAVYAAMGKGNPDALEKRLAPILRLVLGTPHATLADAFEEAHSLLRDNYRSEYFYKNLVISKVIFGRHSPKTASALLELPARSSITDLVILNGTSTAYEIKTDFDSFARLPAQVADYQACFEHVNVVTSLKRAAQAEKLAPESTGIVAIGSRGSLTNVRPSQGGLHRIEPEALFQLLRQSEALSLLSRRLGYVVDVPPGDIWHRSRELFLSLPLEDAHEEVLVELRSRGMQTGAITTNLNFPRALRALAYSTRLSKPSREILSARLGSRATHLGISTTTHL